MKLAAIAVNYRCAKATLEALPALAAEVRGVGGRVLVVDNDSQDGSFELLSKRVTSRPELAGVEVLQSGRNGGFGFGNNVGIRRALEFEPRPRYLLFINPDAVPLPGALQAMVAYLDAHPAVGVAGCTMQDLRGQARSAAFRFPSLLSEFENGVRFGPITRLLDRWVVAPPPEAPPDTPDWVSGACLMTRRETLEQVGFFDERFFLYFEEIDLCYRVRRAGWEIATVRESVVRHDEGTTTGISDKTRRVPEYWFESRERFFRKTYGPGYALAASAIWALGFGCWRVRRRLQRRPDLDPPHMLADFVRFSLLNPLRGDSQEIAHDEDQPVTVHNRWELNRLHEGRVPAGG